MNPYENIDWMLQEYDEIFIIDEVKDFINDFPSESIIEYM